MTNLKLQKLVYYAQAWHLAKFNDPLFKDPIEAWTHGPVIRKLYNHLKKAGNEAITPIQIGGSIENIPQVTQKFLDIIWEKYGKYEAWFLRKLTHNESPWKRARKGCKEDEPSNNILDNDFMARYYSGEIGKFQCKGVK